MLKLHRILHEALHHAVGWQLFAVNPANAVKPPKGEGTEMRFLNVEQARALLDAARGDDAEAPIVTAVYTGLRVGELLGLRWQDVDLERGRVRVVQSIRPTKGGGYIAGATKTHRSQRGVPIPAQVVDVRRGERRRQNGWRLALGSPWPEHDLVFTDAIGRPLTPMRLRWALRRLLGAADAPRIRLHDLRHTMATLTLAAGEHPKVVSERLGHSTVSLTLDTYSHVVPGLQEAAAQRLGDLLSGPAVSVDERS